MSREPYEVWRARKISEEMGATYEAPMYDWSAGMTQDQIAESQRGVVARIIERSAEALAEVDGA